MKQLIKLLMVEDSEDDTLLLMRVLRRGDYDINYERVATRPDMENALQREQWDLIISDFAMPQFSGRDALAVYKESGLDIPFIVTSGTIGETTAVEMMKAGVHDYIMKDNLTRMLPAIERELTEAKIRAERRDAEAALRESEALFRTIVETAPCVLHIMDENGYTIYISPNCQQITGYTADNITNSLVSMVHQDDYERVKNYFKYTFEHGIEVHNFEFKGQRKDDTVWYASASWKPYRDDQETIKGLVVQTVDITERKENEAKLQKLNRALRAINECNQAMVRTVDENVLLNDICRIIVEVGGYRLGWIGFINPGEDKSMRVAAQYGSEDGFISQVLKEMRLTWSEDNPLGRGPLSKAMRQHKTMVVEDIATDPSYTPWCAEALRRGFTAMIALPLYQEETLYGGLAIYSDKKNTFTVDEVTLLESLAQDLSFGLHTLRVRDDRRVALNLLQQSNLDLASAYNATLEGWSRALEMRESETAGHSERVMELTMMMAERMGIERSLMDHIRRGALLHDIGKMAIPDSILLKPGPLTNEEWKVMRKHPVYAFNLLSGINYLRPALDIPYYHHEKWDGSGYPIGLIGEQIPLAARIFAIIDVWDALRSDRPYRSAWSEEKTMEYIISQSGAQFDPAVVEAFQKVLNLT